MALAEVTYAEMTYAEVTYADGQPSCWGSPG
ncbi:hypothetical protein QF026_007892 [Streptomyces aurantiacus]|nr:hypothetical protein [Streptomyces aurantiacus]